jgi:two-component system, cell cycle sensor histidine kinase and response regulator CckA
MEGDIMEDDGALHGERSSGGKEPVRNGDGGEKAGRAERLDTGRGERPSDVGLLLNSALVNAILSAVGDGVIATDAEKRIILMNANAEKLTGWTRREAVGRSLSEIFLSFRERTLERCESPVETAIRTGANSPPACSMLISQSGVELVVASSGAPVIDDRGLVVGAVLAFRDITETRRMETEYVKMDKLDSLGVLAGGLAHDFNNVLCGVVGFITLARMYADESPEICEALEKAEHAALQAKGLTERMRMFSRESIPIKNPVAIGDFVRDSAGLMLAGSNVSCAFELPLDLWTVEVDEGQFSRVIHNLVVNAKEAMPNGGRLTISAENIIVTASGEMPLPPGRHVGITFRDDGVGIAQDNISRIFDPYFTTKAEGNGLGLATVRSIVGNHGGQVTVTSSSGAGAAFTVCLPASMKKSASAKSCRKQPWHGSGNILIMDDDEMVRTAVGDMAQAIGYSVSFAEEGAEAVELYRKAQQAGKSFDAVILDLTIPGGMGGRETIRELLAVDPDARTILTSGHVEGPHNPDYGAFGVKDVIAKPFSLFELSRVLRRVIRDGKDSPGPDH